MLTTATDTAGTKSHSSRRWWLEPETGWLIVLVLATYFSRAHVLPIRGEEPTRAQMAFEMVQRGDWIVPREQGEPFLVRPPLQNWLIALSCLAWGNWGWWAVRFPSLIATLLTTLLIYGYCRTFLTPLGALAAGAAFATLPEMFQMGRQAETEALFTFFVGASLLLWHWGIVRRWPATLTWAVGYGLMALGMLTKGVQAPFYFGGAVVAYFVFTRQWRRLFSLPHLVGIIVAAAILLAWIIPYARAIGWANVPLAWFGDPAITYNSGVGGWRIVETLIHLVKYPATIFAGSLPWSVLLLFFLDRDMRRSIRASEGRLQMLFVTLSIAVAFPTSWIPPGGLPRYFAPLYPCLCVLFGTVVGHSTSANAASALRKGWRQFVMSMGFIIIGGAVAVIGIALLGPYVKILGPIAEPPLVALVYAIVLVGLALVIFRTQKRTDPATARTAVLVIAAFMAIMFIGVVTDARLRRSENAAEAMKQLKQKLPAGQQLVSLNGHTAPLFAYYYGLPFITPRSPLGKRDLGGDLDYFCLISVKNGRPKLPFTWEEIGVVSLDRNHHEIPDRSVVVGRRLGSAGVNAGEEAIRE